MKPMLRIYLAVLISFAITSRLFAGTDQSSPKEAERSFWSAIDQGNADAAKKLCKVDDARGKWVEGFAAMCDGFRKYHDAGVKKFGNDAKFFTKDFKTPGGHAMDLLDKCKVQQDGDTATITQPGVKAPGTIIERENGKWIVDLNKSMKGDLTKAAATYNAVADSARAVAKNIDEGKYTSAEEADKDFREHLKNAMAGMGDGGAK